jgi:phosphopantothenoylcysteine decarboxylase/phosphopantothenate--cysteine ligase
MPTLADTKILLCVTGGIAAYKSPNLVRELRRQGARVRVIMTRSATEFIGPMALQAVSGEAVGRALFDPRFEEQIGHIELARWPDAVLVAPATANSIGKLANGLADDLVSTVLLATTSPVVVAPAMNTQMFRHPSVRKNIELLREVVGAIIVVPAVGDLACGESGEGRLPDPPVLIDSILEALTEQRLSGRRVLVTLGPTREPIDSARHLSNRSSGRMGYAMAAAARHLGAEVIAVAGPTTAPAPAGIQIVSVQTALEMAQATEDAVRAGVDIAVFTAAVADFRPASPADQKISKAAVANPLPLIANPDILATVAGAENAPFCVGFAAETSDIEARSMAKCKTKGCDLIIGNDVSNGAGFGTPDNRVVVADDTTVRTRLGPASKEALARLIWPVIIGAYERSKS